MRRTTLPDRQGFANGVAVHRTQEGPNEREDQGRPDCPDSIAATSGRCRKQSAITAENAARAVPSNLGTGLAHGVATARNRNEPTHPTAYPDGSQAVLKPPIRGQPLEHEVSGKQACSTGRPGHIDPASDRRGSISGGPGAIHSRMTAGGRCVLPASASGLVPIQKDHADSHREAAIRTYEQWMAMQKNEPTAEEHGLTTREK
ncbi:hypothetical protein ARSEF1564_008424 [Beauveria bassiana]